MKVNLNNIIRIFVFIAATSFFISCNYKVKPSLNFDKEEAPISKQNLVGKGVHQVLVDHMSSNKTYISKITLAPNSYTHWHSHPGGQVMIITDGEGFYQSKGKGKIKVKKGDVIETIGGLYHCSGSAENSALSYISIKTVKANGVVNWHEPMTKDRYLASEDENS